MRHLSFTFHSPVMPIELSEFSEAGVQVDIKRDDLIHPFISGNKWRKLQYTLLDAREHGKDHLVTFGGAWSNHLLAVACAGATFGFRTTAFVRGEPVSNPVLSLCRVFGMELRFISRSAYRDKPALYEQFAGSSDSTYFIDEGGYSPFAVRGCAALIDELDRTYDHVFCACGTGATLAGLAKGIANRAWHTRLHGVPVLKDGHFLKEAVERLIPGVPLDNLHLHTEYHFGGYAKHTPELLRFVARFSSLTGILIEPVYTGKACYALADLATQAYFKRGERVLVVHTGGLTGILGKYAELDAAIG